MERWLYRTSFLLFPALLYFYLGSAHWLGEAILAMVLWTVATWIQDSNRSCLLGFRMLLLDFFFSLSCSLWHRIDAAAFRWPGIRICSSGPARGCLLFCGRYLNSVLPCDSTPLGIFKHSPIRHLGTSSVRVRRDKINKETWIELIPML